MKKKCPFRKHTSIGYEREGAGCDRGSGRRVSETEVFEDCSEYQCMAYNDKNECDLIKGNNDRGISLVTGEE